MISSTITIKKYNLENDPQSIATCSEALRAITLFDHEGRKEQIIGNWMVKKNRTNITVTWMGNV